VFCLSRAAVNPGLNAAADTPIVLTRRANFGTPNNDGSPLDGTNARRFQIAARFRFWLAGNFADKIRAGQQTALILFL